MLKVTKFGGSSLADAGQFRKVKAIVEADPARQVVVVSAPGKRFPADHKVTDLLYLAHAHAKYGVSGDAIFQMIRTRYWEIASALGLSADLDAELTRIQGSISKSMLPDGLVSRGEYLCARLMAEFLGYAFLDAADWLRFGYDGSIDMQASGSALRMFFAENPRFVTPGFYGVMPDGQARVMSRGGSDITGALAAALLEADIYENWTDVPGVLMADPRVVADPSPIEQITYAELRELSYMGAEVLNEESIFPVREQDIPLNIRCTNDPEAPGTMISNRFDSETGDATRFITGIAGRKDYSILTIHKNRISREPGMLRRLLEIFEKNGVTIEQMPTGIDSVALVVATEAFAPARYQILDEIEKSLHPESTQAADGISLIAAVGRKMASRPGISGRLFAALGQNDVNVRLISQGPDEISIVFGVENKDFEKTIRILYNSFVRLDVNA